MSLMGDIGHDTEEHYHGKVLDLLIPLLSSEAATSSNEALLATTVILRMSEQFSEVGNDCQRHLKGAAPLFMDGTDWSGIEMNLATACFWTHHRESIRMSFLREQSFGFDFSHLSLLQDDMSLAASSEEVWTNRMTLLLLEIIKACWDEDGEGRPAKYARLRTILQLWRAHLPLAFQPWCPSVEVAEPNKLRPTPGGVVGIQAILERIVTFLHPSKQRASDEVYIKITWLLGPDCF
ncbi:hypothetical protein LTS10_006822 [Elasticomyces elasticus]|nr:hypothetical protein LTS10_006822 [Elasticomyces elasticus]